MDSSRVVHKNRPQTKMITAQCESSESSCLVTWLTWVNKDTFRSRLLFAVLSVDLASHFNVIRLLHYGPHFINCYYNVNFDSVFPLPIFPIATFRFCAILGAQLCLSLSSTVDFYSSVRQKWVSHANRLRNVTVVSLGGGYRDYQVRSGLTSLPCPPGDPNKLSLVVRNLLINYWGTLSIIVNCS